MSLRAHCGGFAVLALLMSFHVRAAEAELAMRSIGPMTFAPGGVLIVGDPQSATVFAIETEDTSSGTNSERQIPDVAKAIATSLNLSAKVELGELAVNPETGNAFLTISAGDSIHLVKIASDSTISKVDLAKVSHTKKVLPNPPEDKEVRRRGRVRNPRHQSITDVAFFEGKIMVTGMSADDSPSQVLEFPFPFADNSVATAVDIFHAAHGRYEDATIRTFLPIMIDGEPNLLAGFQCTPLVRFSVDQLDGTKKVRGTTVAELGNRNTPLDMVVYEKDGKTSVLMSNTARGMMKISTEGIAERQSLSERVSGGGTAGQPFETIEELASVKQMDKLNDTHALALVEQDGSLALKTIALP